MIPSPPGTQFDTVVGTIVRVQAHEPVMFSGGTFEFMIIGQQLTLDQLNQAGSLILL